MSIYMSICKLENAAILRDVLSFWTWQHRKRNNSARIPKFSKLPTSKTKQFCETSFKNGKLSAELTASYQFLLRFVHSTCLKCCACHEKVMPEVIRSAAPVTQNHLPKNEFLMLQNATPLRKSAPSPPNIFDEHVSYSAPATENASLQIIFKCPTPAIVFRNATKPSRSAHFWQGAQSLAPATQNDIWTSKSGTSQLVKVLRSWGVLYILTSKCASRHNGVQLFISHLTTWLRTRRFSEPTFRPSRATNHWKNTVFRDFPTFSRTWIFFLRRLSLFDLLSSSLLFSDSSHLCFSSTHIVGSLTSKLPSVIQWHFGYDIWYQ